MGFKVDGTYLHDLKGVVVVGRLSEAEAEALLAASPLTEKTADSYLLLNKGWAVVGVGETTVRVVYNADGRYSVCQVPRASVLEYFRGLFRGARPQIAEALRAAF